MPQLEEQQADNDLKAFIRKTKEFSILVYLGKNSISTYCRQEQNLQKVFIWNPSITPIDTRRRRLLFTTYYYLAFPNCFFHWTIIGYLSGFVMLTQNQLLRCKLLTQACELLAQRKQTSDKELCVIMSAAKTYEFVFHNV